LKTVHRPRIRRVSLTACAAILTLVPIAVSAPRVDLERSLSGRLGSGPGVLNHPVHVKPSPEIIIPAGWPLDVDGTITCVTCHSSLPSLDGTANPNLRVSHRELPHDVESSGPQFCRNCHSENAANTARGMHWLAVARAHISGGYEEPDSSYNATLDEGSRRCLTCHDGVSSREASYQTTWNSGGGSIGDRARNHPIGVPYPRGGRRHAEVPLRHSANLPAQVRLPGGNVSCLSCHDLYSPGPNRLSVPIERSHLCLACHMLD